MATVEGTSGSHGRAFRPTVMGRRGCVAAAHPLASMAGIEVLLQGGSAWGTAFPSSHVAAALVASAAALRGSRPLGAVLLCASFLLALATVYCQFHYSVDALAGALLAAIVLLVSRRVAV